MNGWLFYHRLLSAFIFSLCSFTLLQKSPSTFFLRWADTLTCIFLYWPNSFFQSLTIRWMPLFNETASLHFSKISIFQILSQINQMKIKKNQHKYQYQRLSYKVDDANDGILREKHQLPFPCRQNQVLSSSLYNFAIDVYYFQSDHS